MFYYIHHSNVSHGQHEGQGEVAEGPSEENTDVWESEQSDGGHEVNLTDWSLIWHGDTENKSTYSVKGREEKEKVVENFMDFLSE